MERVILRYDDTVKALKTLKEALDQPYSEIIRDAAIQRFEYTFELCWKLCRTYLKEQGIIENSPKGVFREIMRQKLLSEDDTEKFLKMTDDRNLTVHVYKEELAQKIFERISTEYIELFDHLISNFKQKLNN